MKPAAHYRGREQTYLKHFFLERYLETVAFHIGYTHREFAYVDCFSGPWRPADEELADTSIRISLDKLNYVPDALASRQRQVNIKAIFIERDPLAFRSLETALEQHRRSINTVALPGTFEDNIPAVLNRLGGAFAFFFIDPTGWTGFAMDHIAPILRHQPGEVMVNFMYDFINRSINYSDPVNEQSLDEFFGTTDWRNVRAARDREAASIDLYKEQLRRTGAYKYVTSTRILKPLHERAYFHLIYATRNPKGILEFRDVERQTVKEQDSVRRAAQRTHRETKTGQSELEFDDLASLSDATRLERIDRLKQAQNRVLDALEGGPIMYEKLQPLVLEIPLVWSTDLSSILMDLYKAGRISIGGFTARQRAPKVGNRIQLR